MAMKMPMWRPWRTGLPQNTGSRADSTTSFEIGTEPSGCSGPPNPKR